MQSSFRGLTLLGLDMGKYGENIGASLAPNPGKDKTALEVIQSFADEKPLFVPSTSDCETGTVCQHYTRSFSQLSTQVGCGQATCTSNGYTTIMYVCNYAGPGNIKNAPPATGYKVFYPNQK